MLIVCPHCASTYDIEPAALGETGRPVRCGVCRTLWHATPDADDDLLSGPIKAASRQGPLRRKASFKQRMDKIVRVCAILIMAAMGGFTGFAMTGEWPRSLIPLARGLGLEKPLWPELDSVVARLETTQEGATVLSIEGEWIGAVRSAPTPAVEFAVRNSTGEEVARWTDRSGPTKLPAGETAPFRSRFAVPGGDAREVKARYVGFTPDRAE